MLPELIVDTGSFEPDRSVPMPATGSTPGQMAVAFGGGFGRGGGFARRGPVASLASGGAGTRRLTLIAG